MKFAAVRPPDDGSAVLIESRKRQVSVKIRFSVSYVATSDYTEPEAARHLRAREISPAPV